MCSKGHCNGPDESEYTRAHHPHPISSNSENFRLIFVNIFLGDFVCWLHLLFCLLYMLPLSSYLGGSHLSRLWLLCLPSHFLQLFCQWFLNQLEKSPSSVSWLSPRGLLAVRLAWNAEMPEQRALHQCGELVEQDPEMLEHFYLEQDFQDCPPDL